MILQVQLRVVPKSSFFFFAPLITHQFNTWFAPQHNINLMRVNVLEA